MNAWAEASRLVPPTLPVADPDSVRFLSRRPGNLEF